VNTPETCTLPPNSWAIARIEFATHLTLLGSLSTRIGNLPPDREINRQEGSTVSSELDPVLSRRDGAGLNLALSSAVLRVRKLGSNINV
jgi:hypothetical protein